MKNLITLILILIFSINLFSQDIDIYRKNKDDNLVIPNLPLGMSNNEIQLLSRNLRLKDMLYAMAVPGYVHFKAQDIKTGYLLMGGRMLGYAGLALAYYKFNTEIEKKWYQLNKPVNDEDYVKFDNGFYIKKSNIYMVTSMAIIFSTYMYDWIHGEYILKKKQNIIRYKYGLKLQVQDSYSYNNSLNIFPVATFNVSF